MSIINTITGKYQIELDDCGILW